MEVQSQEQMKQQASIEMQSDENPSIAQTDPALQKSIAKTRSHLRSSLESSTGCKASLAEDDVPRRKVKLMGEGKFCTKEFSKKQLQELVSGEEKHTEDMVEYTEKVEEFVANANELSEVNEYLQNVKIVLRAYDNMTIEKKGDKATKSQQLSALKTGGVEDRRSLLSRELSQNEQMAHNIYTKRYAELKARKKELKANKKLIMIEVKRLEATLYA